MKYIFLISFLFSIESYSKDLKFNYLSFLMQKNVVKTTSLKSGPICHPDQSSQTSCVETSCKRLGPFDCDSIDEIQKVSRCN